MSKILISGQGITNLELYAAVITQFDDKTGDLTCRHVVLLAENHTEASTLLAIHFAMWEIQTLHCLTGLPWFLFITLDSNCPQVQTLKQFVIPNLEAVPADDDD